MFVVALATTALAWSPAAHAPHRLPWHGGRNRPPLCIGVASSAEDAAWLVGGVSAVRASNHELLPLLTELREARFFRFYPVDLLAGCAYMPTHEAPCELDACEVDVAEEVPAELIERDESEYEFELDSWARWDMPSDFTEYYDLKELPEAETGYDGSDIWRFVHSKICFQKGLELDENGWKRDFNRAVSGVHSAVSASIIGDIEEKGDVEGALSEYRRRLRDEPGALDNLHFAFMLSLNAIRDLTPRLRSCAYVGEGGDIGPTINELTDCALFSDEGVASAAANLREHADDPACAAWKLRMRTRDLLLLMNCVQCNLCRLHGKVTVLGLAATLQVLLGMKGRGEESCNRPPDPTSLHRVEVAALVTTAAKLSKAVAVAERFGAMDAAEGAA